MKFVLRIHFLLHCYIVTCHISTFHDIRWGNGYSGLLEIGEEQENQQPDDHRQGNAL